LCLCSSIESTDGISSEVSLLKEILVRLVVGFVFIVIAKLVESGLELRDVIGLKANQHSTKKLKLVLLLVVVIFLEGQHSPRQV
jgi:hypothetical protein